MDIQAQINEITGFKNLELLAGQVVEGFISGLHKSPFHGFSAEFAEHKVYNAGESTKHIDWKLYAKTDKLFTKRYEEETNLRCHLIIDNSPSMHYPQLQKMAIDHLNKIAFSVLGAAALMNLLKRQRDAVGMSIFSENYDFYTAEKGSERHHQMLLHRLNDALSHPATAKQTAIYKHLHLIAEKMKRRSLVFLFSDMLQTEVSRDKLFESLRHLKYNKHEVVLFHTIDKSKEQRFDYDNKPRKFVDVETGDFLNVYPDNIKENYEKAVSNYFKELKLKCAQYRIKYVEADINAGFSKILTTYLIERQKFT
jgi:uncharacterized protein (DUF58 family)